MTTNSANSLKRVLSTSALLKRWNDDSKLALGLLKMKDFNIAYCNSTKMVLKIGYIPDDILLDKDERDDNNQNAAGMPYINIRLS